MASKTQNDKMICVVQDARTDKVLRCGWTNPKAVKKSQRDGNLYWLDPQTGNAVLHGKENGEIWKVMDLRQSGDGKSVLVKVNPLRSGTGQPPVKTDYAEDNASALNFLHTLENIIRDRKQHPLPNSHTSRLFKRGINKIAQKVGEEAVELIIEAKDSNHKLFVEECADLLYHMMVLLEAKDAQLAEVVEVLAGRNKVQS